MSRARRSNFSPRNVERLVETLDALDAQIIQLMASLPPTGEVYLQTLELRAALAEFRLHFAKPKPIIAPSTPGRPS